MYASRKIKFGSQKISIHLKLPLGVFDFDVIYERNEIERQKKNVQLKWQSERVRDFLCTLSMKTTLLAVFEIQQF